MENLSIANTLELNNKVKKTPAKNIIEDKNPENRRVLRERKATNSKAVKKSVEKKREIRKRAAKNAATTEQLSKNKNSRATSLDNLASFFRHRCPECELNFDRSLCTFNQCPKCQSYCVYVCVKCNRQYKLLTSIKNHVLTVCYPQKIYSCQLCKYASTRNYHVKRHVLNKHNSKIKALPTLIQSIDVGT